jgi:hypothetical protein
VRPACACADAAFGARAEGRCEPAGGIFFCASWRRNAARAGAVVLRRAKKNSLPAARPNNGGVFLPAHVRFVGRRPGRHVAGVPRRMAFGISSFWSTCHNYYSVVYEDDIIQYKLVHACAFTLSVILDSISPSVLIYLIPL